MFRKRKDIVMVHLSQQLHQAVFVVRRLIAVAFEEMLPLNGEQPLNSNQQYYFKLLMALRANDEVFAGTFLSTCVFCSGVMNDVDFSMAEIVAICGIPNTVPKSLFTLHMDKITAIVPHHIKTASHYFEEIVTDSDFCLSNGQLFWEHKQLLHYSLFCINNALEGTVSRTMTP